MDKTLLIDIGESLIIEAGTTIELSENAKIASYGSVFAMGHSDQPITIKSNNTEWEIIRILREADSLIFNNVNIINGNIYTHDCHVIYNSCQFINNRTLEWNQSLSSNHGGSLHITDCKSSGNNTGEGFLCYNMEYPIIENCKFSKVPDPIEYIQCTNGIISDNLMENNTDDGIDLNACTNIIIENNIITNISDKGIEIGHTQEGISSGIIIRNNTINHSHTGIHLMEKSEAHIVNNKFDSNKVNILLTELDNLNRPESIEISSDNFSNSDKRIRTDSISTYVIVEDIKEEDLTIQPQIKSHLLEIFIACALLILLIFFVRRFL